DVQQVVDQPGEVDDLPLDGLASPRPLLVGGSEGAHDVEAGADRRQWVAQLVAEHGQELVLAPAGLAERRLGPFAIGDVAVDPRRPHEATHRVADRREGEGDVEPLAVLAHPRGLEGLDPLALPKLLEDRRHLSPALGATITSMGWPIISAAV